MLSIRSPLQGSAVVEELVAGLSPLTPGPESKEDKIIWDLKKNCTEKQEIFQVLWFFPLSVRTFYQCLIQIFIFNTVLIRRTRDWRWEPWKKAKLSNTGEGTVERNALSHLLLHAQTVHFPSLYLFTSQRLPVLKSAFQSRRRGYCLEF